MSFYHVCLHYPDALKPGFPTLRTLLDSPRVAVQLATLTVMLEFCIANPSNFVTMIPKFFKMLEQKAESWITIKVIQILTVLASAEPRLPKKLVQIYSNLVDASASVSVVYEVCRSMVQTRLTSPSLLQLTINRLQSYINSGNQDVRFLFLEAMMGLLKLSPKAAAQNRELISDCLDSEDESQRLMALELLGSMTNAKNVDKIVAKMFQHFQTAVTIRFRNQIITTVIEICSRDDYKLVTNFDWYISVLLDFVTESGFTCYKIVADQFLDLALRVPSTRQRLAKEMPVVFEKNCEYPDTTPLLLAAAHMIGEYCAISVVFDRVIGDRLMTCAERVQQAFLTAAVKFFVRCKPKPKQLVDRVRSFAKSPIASLQVDAIAYAMLCEQLLADAEACDALSQYMQEQDNAMDEEPVAEIAQPREFAEPDDLFTEPAEEAAVPKVPQKKPPPKKKAARPKKNAQKKSEDTVVLKKSRTKAAEPRPDTPAADARTVLGAIGANSVLRVDLQAVSSQGNQLSLELLVTNLAAAPLTLIDVQLTHAQTYKAIDVASISGEIAPNASHTHTIVIEVVKPPKPLMIRAIFTPVSCGGECLESRIRIFPSYFLKAAKPDAFPVDDCVHGHSVQTKLKVTPLECIKAIVKVLRSKMVRDTASKTVNLYATASYGASVLTNFACDGTSATITLKSSVAELTDSLVREIDMTLKSLSRSK
jgi:AP-3 complex subunit delta-1